MHRKILLCAAALIICIACGDSGTSHIPRPAQFVEGRQIFVNQTQGTVTAGGSLSTVVDL